MYTEQQAAALATRDTSVALSAGAGCGKTFVLTERYLAAIADQSVHAGATDALDKIVAITFTDAAAREMRDRIRRRIYDELDHSRGQESDRWLALLRAIDASRISTIHSFCTTLLRTHAVPAGLDPEFRVLEQAEADVVAAEAVDEMLRQDLAEHDEQTIDLAATWGVEALKRDLRRLLDSRHDEAFATWCEASEQNLLDCWRAAAGDLVQLSAEEIAVSPDAQRLLQILASSRVAGDKFAHHRQTLCDLLATLPASNDPRTDLGQLAEFAKVQGVTRSKDWDDANAFRAYRDVCTRLRDRVKKATKVLDFDNEAALPVARHGLQLLRMARRAASAYEERKAQLAVLDFDDLLARTHRLLANPANESIRQALRDGIYLLVVDEFQDTDPLQAQIVRTICGEELARGKLFFVGDEKQSIYRFRGAAPRVFQQLQADMARSGRHSLTTNFRSQPAILDFVNAVFEPVFRPRYEPLVANREQVTPQPSVEFLWHIDPQRSPQNKGSIERARQTEARWIARRLAALIDSGEPLIGAASGDERATRPLQAGDVAILFRSLSDVRHYEDALREYGLDYYLVGGHAFYAQQEIYDISCLLRAVARENDEISLAGALRSPFFALDDEMLFLLVRHAGSLGQAMDAESLPSAFSPQQRDRARRGAAILRELRARKDDLPVADLIQLALQRTGYDASLLCEFLGPRKLANLHKLLDMARQSDSAPGADVNSFIDRLDDVMQQQPHEPMAATSAEAGNVIRLMTIHQAKGLEFPLVVVADLDRTGHGQTAGAIFDSQLGPLVPGRDTATGMDIYRRREAIADVEELSRLFYVACTRAADYLLLSSSVRDLADSTSPWMQILASRFDLSTGALTQETQPGLGVPRVRVTSDKPRVTRRLRGKSRRANLPAVIQRAREASPAAGRVPDAVQPVAPNVSARGEYSFSWLDGQIAPVADFTATDEFVSAGSDTSEPSPLDPRQFGSLVHEVFEHCDLTQPETIPQRCRVLARQRFPQFAEQAAREAADLLLGFLDSSRGREISTAAVVYRELEFLLRWPPQTSAPDAASKMWTGFIDVLYQDRHGDYHLVDLKTNALSDEQLASAAERYELQLSLYALAAERVLAEPPVDLTLSFLRPHQEFSWPWDDECRERTIEQLNRAIAQTVLSA